MTRDADDSTLRARVQRCPQWDNLVAEWSAIVAATTPWFTAFETWSPALRRFLTADVHDKLVHYAHQDRRAGRSSDPLSFDAFRRLQRNTCWFCDAPLAFLYAERYDPRQWTLDRIDNNQSHTEPNLRMTCLRCNLAHADRNSFLIINVITNAADATNYA